METTPLDRLSGGRVTLAVGMGSDRFAAEFSKSGDQLDGRLRGQMLGEALRILTAAWSREPVHYHGTHYVVDDMRFLPWHEAFPHGSKFQGRAMPRQIHLLDLDEIGADAELDIVAAGTPLAEFHQLSLAAMEQRCLDAGIMADAEARARIDRLGQPDFLACGFAHIGVWGRRPAGT